MPFLLATSPVQLRGLYRGLSAPLLGGALETGVNYAMYEEGLRLSSTVLTLPQAAAIPAAAGVAGLVLSFVLSPFELIKVWGGGVLAMGAWGMGAWGMEGVSSRDSDPWEGEIAGWVRSLHHVLGWVFGALCCYAPHLNPDLRCASPHPHPPSLLCMQCRMQSGVPGHHYSGPYQCLQQIVRLEGYWGLTRGLVGTMAREIPGNAIYFTSYMVRGWYTHACILMHPCMLCVSMHPCMHASVYAWLVAGCGRLVTSHAEVSLCQHAVLQALRDVVPGRPRADGLGTPRTMLQALADAGSAIACGGLAGMAMWMLVLPIDVAKTRIQVAHPRSPEDVGLWRQLVMLHARGALVLLGRYFGVWAILCGVGDTLLYGRLCRAVRSLGRSWSLIFCHRAAGGPKGYP